LGKVTCGTGNYQEAQSLYEQSLTISQEIEDPAGILQALINLGEVACLTGDPAIAKEHLQTALALSRKTNNRQAMVQVLVYLGQTALLTQSHDEARNFFQQSLMLSRKINDDHGAATAFGHLGRLATEMGAYPTARDYFIEALRLTSKQSAVPQLLELLIGFANLLSAKAEAHHAVELIAGIEPYLPPNQPLAVELADLRARLAQTLPPDDFASAFERGQSDSLEGMVARLVAAA
jgi:tetratricopeptide (TPR) repeat protein